MLRGWRNAIPAGTAPARAPSRHPCGQRSLALPGPVPSVPGAGWGCSCPQRRAGHRAGHGSDLSRWGRQLCSPSPGEGIDPQLPTPRPVAGSWLNSIQPPPSLILYSLLSPYSKHSPYGRAEVHLHSRTNPSTRGDAGKPALLLCTITTTGQNTGNMKELGTTGSSASPSSAPEMLHHPSPATAALGGREGGQGLAEPVWSRATAGAVEARDDITA